MERAEQGREPTRAEALCTLLMGLGVMLFAFWSVARRFQLERELADAAHAVVARCVVRRTKGSTGTADLAELRKSS